MVAALGAIGTPIVGAMLSRTRLNRLDIVSRVLKDLPVHDPAHASLAKVREEDARALLRQQGSPWTWFIGTNAVAIGLAFVMSEFGESIKSFSLAAFNLLTALLLGSYLAVIGLYLGLLIGGAVLLVRKTYPIVLTVLHRQRKSRSAPSKRAG